MLAADKLQLQSALKQQAVALKEKEFELHHSNLMTVGTQVRFRVQRLGQEFAYMV